MEPITGNQHNLLPVQRLFALQREKISTGPTWAAGPGFYISHLGAKSSFHQFASTHEFAANGERKQGSLNWSQEPVRAGQPFVRLWFSLSGK